MLMFSNAVCTLLWGQNSHILTFSNLSFNDNKIFLLSNNFQNVKNRVREKMASSLLQSTVGFCSLLTETETEKKKKVPILARFVQGEGMFLLNFDYCDF